MPTNVTHEYENAEKKFFEAETIPAKLEALQEMLSTVPKHKGTENLRVEIKQKISKLKALLAKEKQQRKGKGFQIGVKKEGAAQVILIGKTNSGKSYVLSKLTNAKPLIADYEFSTKLPEVGTMDYKGIKIQVVEIPAIVEDFVDKGKGPLYLGIIRTADLVIVVDRDSSKNFIVSELEKGGVNFKGLVVKNKDLDFSDLKEKIWKRLDLIYVYTKSPGKKKDDPPVSLKKGESVRDLAGHVHKDFIQKFKYARIWGSSAKHDGMSVGLNHVLKEGDVVELHLK